MMNNVTVKSAVVACLVSLAACSRPSGCCCCGESGDSTSVVALSVPVSGLVPAPAAGSSAPLLQVLAFVGGETVSHIRASHDAGSVVFEVEGSPFDVLAMVGGPDLSETATEEGCMAAAFSLDSCHGCLPQAGLLSGCHTAAVWHGEVGVTPLICRVHVDTVSRLMADTLLARVPMAVTRVFLANAVSVARLDGAMPADPGWRSSMLASGGAMAVADTFLFRRLPAPLALDDGSSVALGMDFYCCPNGCGSDRVDARATRPVVAVAADTDGDGVFSPDEEMFYPLPLGALSAGGFYSVTRLEIAHLGNPSDGDDVVDPGEDDPVARAGVSFSVTVAPWDAVLMGDGGRLEY